MSNLTTLLNSDTPQSAEKLLPLVYEELRHLAASRMARENGHQTLQATALVHEAWIKVAGSNRQDWRGRTHFFGAAAEAMRRILIDQARRKSAQKRGSGVEPNELHETRIELKAPAEEILMVHEALDVLAAKDPVNADVVKMKYFVGMTFPDIAQTLGLSLSTVERHWSFARTWLKNWIRKNC